MHEFTEVALPAAFGSAMQELGYWWQLRFNLEAEKYRKQMTSPLYWFLVVLMVIGSSLGTVYWFDGQNVAAKDCVVFGAGFPLIFKHATAILAQRQNTLGVRSKRGPDHWSVLRTYFDMK